MKENKQMSHTRSFPDYGILGLKGFCMGASDVVPGVSGGTMAFILGIYEELINAIRSFDFQSLKLLATLRIRAFLERVSWPFLLAVGVGILTAIFTLARVLTWLLQNKPVMIWSFFFGLILASVWTVSRGVQHWQILTWLFFLGGMVGTYVLVGVVPVSTPDDLWFLFASGAIAICAMILPGISGSFILVLLGKYEFVLQAVNQKDFLLLLTVAAGACLGIIAFSRLLGWLLERYHDLMVALLTGLMLGSLRKIWPWKEMHVNILPPQWDGEVASALIFMAVGLAVVLILDRVSRIEGSSG